MKPTIYIHIGPHKTGTTSIQHGLKMNENLLKKQGVLCPNAGRPWHNSAATHNLAWELRNPNGKRFKAESGTWAEVMAEIEGEEDIHTVILSSEDFCLLRSEQFKVMKDYVKDYPTKFILYLRRQDKAVQSLWAEFVRSNTTPGKIESFYDWLEKHNYSYPSYEYLNIINKIDTVFSPGHVMLRLFTPKDFRENLFYDFLYLCEVDPKGCENPPNVNVSSGVMTIEAIRLIKRGINFEKLDKQIWTFLKRCIEQYGNEHGWNVNKLNYLDPELSKMILQHHAANNKIIATQYYQKEELFDTALSKKSQTSTFTYDDFSKSDLNELYAYLLKRLSSRK